MRKVLRWFTANADVLAFTAALLSTGPLMAHWAILTRATILRNHELTLSYIRLTEHGNNSAALLEALESKTQRQLFMIAGESFFGASLFILFVLVLFMFSRRRGNAQRRMQSMLQFTAHELKTPISGVRGVLQSLMLGSIPQDRREYFLHQGIGACDRLEHLAETILAYQRTVSKASRQLKTMNTRTLVESILNHRRATISDENIVWQGAAETNVRVDVDAFRVILENLIDNAKKYGGGGPIQLNARVNEGHWCLDVRDEGAGFDPNSTAELFEPFLRRRNENATTHGSGLGLHLSRQLARQMGGDLLAHSNGLKQGSTFTVQLMHVLGTARAA